MSDQTRQKRVSDASIPGFFIPRNKSQWVRLYNASGLKNRTIQDLEVMELASRCTDSQYIAVRSIAITRKPKWFLRNLDKFGLEEAKKKADEMLARSSNFASFLKLIRENNLLQSLRGELDEDWQGAWRAVRSLHEQIVWKRPSVERADAGHTTSDSRLDTVEPPIKDEAVTNAAIIAYLDTTADLRLIEAANNSQWVHNHVDMGARFHSRPEGRYVTKVDGVLWTRKKEVQALVEVKKHRRAHDFSATVKEETCQMAGFLKNVKNSHLPLNGHRLLMAEDDDEMWPIFASWTHSYLSYIRNSSRKFMDRVPSDAMLTMQAIGPWPIHDAYCMRELTSVALAVFIKANE